jgi:predicted nucleic acid-binding protein
VYLLDTNVVSELRRPRPHRGVLAWLNDVRSSDVHIAAVTIGELQAGIEITREQDASKAEELEKWLALVATSFDVLNVDARVYRRWAQLMHRRSRDLSEDAMIAAVAAVNNMIVVTRNVRDFEPFGATTLNPFGRPTG